MTTTEILQALQNLTSAERLTIAEAALGLAHTDWQSLNADARRTQLELAAAAAVVDYETNPELTVFTELDGEDFCEELGEDVE
jgi:hypothetical protein